MHPAAFLLIFIGPLGWLILVAMAFRPERTYLEIPISEAVYEQIQERRQRVRWLSAVIIIGTALLLYLESIGPFSAPWLALAPVLAGGMGLWAGRVRNPQFRVSVDRVGLVTINRCHPNFVAAVEQWRLTAAAFPGNQAGYDDEEYCPRSEQATAAVAGEHHRGARRCTSGPTERYSTIPSV